MAAVSNNNNVLDSFYCPVHSEPLTDAVMLIPCGHTIGEVAARQMYKGMQDEGVEQKGPCPLCRVTVKSYFPNYAVRDLVDAHVKGLLIAKPVADPEVVAQAAAAPEKNVHEIPFPGKGANFKTWEGNVYELNCDSPYVFIDFISPARENSFFRAGKFIYVGKSLSIYIFIHKENKAMFMEYMEKCGVIPDKECTYREEFLEFTFEKNVFTMQRLFKILIMHNSFPETPLSQMHETMLAVSKADNDEHKDAS